MGCGVNRKTGVKFCNLPLSAATPKGLKCKIVRGRKICTSKGEGLSGLKRASQKRKSRRGLYGVEGPDLRARAYSRTGLLADGKTRKRTNALRAHKMETTGGHFGAGEWTNRGLRAAAGAKRAYRYKGVRIGVLKPKVHKAVRKDAAHRRALAA